MKNKISWITLADVVIYGIIIWFIIYAKIKGMESYEAFRVVVREDGWVEYLTALFLLFGALVLGKGAIKSIKEKNTKQIVFFTLASLVFIFGAGEEISWGQRIFGVESSEYFMENNYQGETNLHNLEFGGVDLNKLIFSQLMFVALIVYFVFLPAMVWKIKSIRKLTIDFGVPIPRMHHTIMLLATNIFIIAAISMKKESELHELALTGILFLVFLNPAQKIKDVVLQKGRA